LKYSNIKSKFKQHEKNIIKMQHKMADKLYDFKQMELDQRARDLQRAEEECRRAINSAVNDYNEALRREQDQKRAIKKMQEQDDNMTEIANAIFSDLLTENPDQAISAFGPNRVVPDRWKGMSPEQIEKIRKEQLRQIEEKNVTFLILNIIICNKNINIISLNSD
jgi:hypothetical protein